jgi:hypothetical protein
MKDSAGAGRYIDNAHYIEMIPLMAHGSHDWRVPVAGGQVTE